MKEHKHIYQITTIQSRLVATIPNHRAIALQITRS